MTQFLGNICRYKNCHAEMRCELVRGRNDSQYEHSEISPETIEQELRLGVCEQRQTDRQSDFKENYTVDSPVFMYRVYLQEEATPHFPTVSNTQLMRSYNRSLLHTECHLWTGVSPYHSVFFFEYVVCFFFLSIGAIKSSINTAE